MRTGFDDLFGRALVGFPRLRGIPSDKRELVRGALMASDADGTRGPDAKARIIADAFHVDFAVVRPLVR